MAKKPADTKPSDAVASGQKIAAVKTTLSPEEIKEFKMNRQRAQRMAHVAKYGGHSYMYLPLARQIVKDFKIRKGECLDIGCGNALLSIELAKITDLKISALDISPYMIELAQKEITESGLEERISLYQAAAEDMPFEENRFDLIVSKGTLWFFSDKVKALREIYRVLKPGGVAYIGCGDPRSWLLKPSDFIKKIRFKIEMRNMRRNNSGWQKLRQPPGDWEVMLNEARISNYRFYKGNFWIEMHK
jgi:ubiquinone/menaquinone biosynthesis C-methylase UbiE